LRKRRSKNHLQRLCLYKVLILYQTEKRIARKTDYFFIKQFVSVVVVWALPKPTQGFAPGPHRLLKKAGENFALDWALPNPPGALPLDPFFVGLYIFFTDYIEKYDNFSKSPLDFFKSMCFNCFV